MSDRTPGGGPGGPDGDRVPDPTTSPTVPPPDAPGVDSPADRAPEGGGRRRLPLWVPIGTGVLVVAAVVVAVVLLTGRQPEVAPVPEAEVVTLAPPSPTVEPIERAAGTPFLDALPSTVLAFALSSVAEEPSLLQSGALESYRLDYTDGSQTVVVRAAQWPGADGAAAAFATAAAALTGTGEPSEGPVEVDGAEVGRYLVVPGSEGAGTALWTNGTVLVQVEGPADSVKDVFAAFPL